MSDLIVKAEKGYALTQAALFVLLEAAEEVGWAYPEQLARVLRDKRSRRTNTVRDFWAACARKAPAFGDLDQYERDAVFALFVMTLETQAKVMAARS